MFTTDRYAGEVAAEREGRAAPARTSGGGSRPPPPRLSWLLTNQALILVEPGRLDEAAALAEEAVGHHRALAGRRSEAFAADLGDSLVVRADCCAIRAGRRRGGSARVRRSNSFESGARPGSVGETGALLDSLIGHGDSA